MADGDLCETDILALSEQQAAALRELASRRDLPNALDLAHAACPLSLNDIQSDQLSPADLINRLRAAQSR